MCFAIVAVLASLSALYIQRRFDYDYVEVSDVTMETVAVSSSDNLDVSYVENCTCDSTLNFGGGRGYNDVMTSCTQFISLPLWRE